MKKKEIQINHMQKSWGFPSKKEKGICVRDWDKHRRENTNKVSEC